MSHAARVFAVALVLLAPGWLQTSPALKFTLHIDLIQSEGSAPNDLAKLVAQLATQAVPPGGVDQTVIVSETATRMEQHQAFVGMPAGIVTLFRDDGEYGFDPSARTFWKEPARLSAEEISGMLAAKPEIKVDKTGTFETIDGRRAERITTTLAVPADVVSAPIPGLPQNLVVTIDAWVTDAVKVPGNRGLPVIDQKLLAQLGLSHLKQFTDDRFLVKAAVRLNFVSGIEMVMTVKDVTQVQTPASTFEIPAGYKEVRPPLGRLRAEGASASLAGALAEAGRGGLERTSVPAFCRSAKRSSE